MVYKYFKFTIISLLIVFSVNLWAQSQDPYALYADAEYSKAAESFLDAASETGSNEKKGHSYYNAARSYQEDYKKEQSPESLQTAIDLYYRALKLDPDNKSAANNLELAKKEKMKNEQQSGDSEDQKQSDQSGDSKDQKQTDQSGDSEDQKQSDQPGDNLSDRQEQLSNRDDQSSEDHQKEQKQLNQETSEQMKNAENSTQEKQLEEALKKQEDALSKMEQNQSEEAKQAQKEAADMLKQYEASKNENETDGSEPLDKAMQQILNAEQSRKDQEEKKQLDTYNVERNW